MGDGKIIGLNIEGKDQGRPAAEIISQGTAEHSSIGAEVDVSPAPGQSATGVRISQTGLGTGARVVQSGLGKGLKISVRIPPEKG